jgi:hypothetical protein
LLVLTRQRLSAFRADPTRHARYALKALLKYHLLDWFERAAPYRTVWQRLGRPCGSAAACSEQRVHELAGAGVLRLQGGLVLDH